MGEGRCLDAHGCLLVAHAFCRLHGDTPVLVHHDIGLPPDFLEGVRFATFSMGDAGYVFYSAPLLQRPRIEHCCAN